MKRLCLFAGYNNTGHIADYVVYYIKSLSELADVYYMADCEMKNNELEKLSPYTKGAYTYRHKKYDFGSWQELINKIGWQTVEIYDELILVNDSVFGPLYPLNPIFDSASTDSSCDFWGITGNDVGDYVKNISRSHLQSYFIVLKRDAFMSKGFRNFIETIEILDSKDDVIQKYEMALTDILYKEGFTAKKYANSPLEPYNYWKTHVISGTPFIKTRVFTDVRSYKYRETLTGWDSFIESISGYNPELIRTYPAYINFGYFSSFKYRLPNIIRCMKQARKWIYNTQHKQGKKIVTLFGCCIAGAKPKSINPIENLKRNGNI